MLILGGDETALAAISQIIEVLPEHIEVAAHLETATALARPALPSHPRLRVSWLTSTEVPGQAVADALGHAEFPDGTRLWAAGEAAAMQRLRQRLFQGLALPRSQATIRGYWKHGRTSEDDPEAG
jgi:NADPH-dependent ferric siderophore reductase